MMGQCLERKEFGSVLVCARLMESMGIACESLFSRKIKIATIRGASQEMMTDMGETLRDECHLSRTRRNQQKRRLDFSRRRPNFFNKSFGNYFTSILETLMNCLPSRVSTVPVTDAFSVPEQTCSLVFRFPSCSRR